MDSIVQILEKQAKRWAYTKRGKSIVNRYSYREDMKFECMFF